MIKLDLHTHSILSQDGAITQKQYTELLNASLLDVVAITDHNDIRFAQELQQQLGEKIIVGEEIRSKEGEVIGLFLTKRIAPYLSLKETVAAIHRQKGLVYIPHPFETLRLGVAKDLLAQVIHEIDIIETFNARSLQRQKGKLAEHFAYSHHIVQTASSDAHCRYGLTTSYAILTEVPTAKTLVSLLSESTLVTKPAPLWTYLCPAINRLKKRLGGRTYGPQHIVSA